MLDTEDFQDRRATTADTDPSPFRPMRIKLVRFNRYITGVRQLSSFKVKIMLKQKTKIERGNG